MKHLLEHLTGLLAAALAILFAIGMVYCTVYLDSFTTYARSQLTFVDVVNTAVNTSPGPILLVSIALLCVATFHFEEYAIAKGWAKKANKLASTIIASAMFLILVAYFFSLLSRGLGAL